MSSAPIPEGVPPGAPVVPQGPVPAVGVPNSQDYPRLVYTAPRFEVVAIADIIEPSVLEACEALLPTLVPPYVNQAAIDAVNATAVRRAGDTMTGPLNLSPVIPTANAMAASKQYVDTMIATGAIPEVPPVPSGQAWARETGQWVPIAGGGTVTNIATGAGLTGGPITATGTIAMANMAGNTLKGNNTGTVAAPTDLNVGQVMTMLGAAPLNSPTFTGSPSLPTGTAAVTQPGGTSDTTVATTAFVANSLTPYAPIASPIFTGAPNLPTGTIAVTQTAGNSSTAVATTAFVGTALGSALPLTGGTLAGPGNLTVRGGILAGAAGAVPAAGALTLNANTVAGPAAANANTNLRIVGSDNQSGNVAIEVDSFGTTGVPVVLGRAARGTAAVPTATQNNDFLLAVQGVGYGTSGYGLTSAASIEFHANENWTATAQGTRLVLNTNVNGTAAPVSSLTLAGNTATFSAGVTIDNQGSGGRVTATNGYKTQAGSGGTDAGAHVYNISWGASGPAHLWIDTADQGSINVTPCDERLKTNLKAPTVDALGAINAIALKQFDWLANDLVPEHHETLGFTAQQLNECIPDAVTVPDDPDAMLSVQLTPIVAHLIGAVQQLKAELDALKTSLGGN